jgi:hypothetical protein
MSGLPYAIFAANARRYNRLPILATARTCARKWAEAAAQQIVASA